MRSSDSMRMLYIPPNDLSTAKTLRNTRNEFLDAYRGSLVLVALFSHLHFHKNSNIVKIAHIYEYTYSTCGFLSLASFLLTYDLIVDLHKTAQSLTQSLLQCLKYFIRRFFRVYLFYAAAYSLYLAVIGNEDTKSSWSQVVQLKSPGNNLFLPIYCAIQYGILLPLICIIIRLVGRFAMILLLASSMWSVNELIFNNDYELAAAPNDFMPKPFADFRTNFVALFAGSQAGLALFLIERNETLSRCVKYKNIQSILSYVSSGLVLLGLESRTSSAGLFWSYLLLISVLNQPTTLTKMFESSLFLKQVGRITFSFHIFGYLLIHVLREMFTKMGVLNSVTIMDVRLGAIVIFVSFFAALLSAKYLEAGLIRCGEWLCKQVENYQPLLKSLRSSTSTNSLI